MITASVAVSLRALLEGGLVLAGDKWSYPCRLPRPGLQAPRWPDHVVHVPPSLGRGVGRLSQNGYGGRSTREGGYDVVATKLRQNAAK